MKRKLLSLLLALSMVLPLIAGMGIVAIAFPSFRCTYNTEVAAGENLRLALGENVVRNVDIEEAEGGFAIKYKGSYVAFDEDTKSVVESEEPYTWNYDGGLYAVYTKNEKKRSGYFTKWGVKKTSYYLAFYDEFYVTTSEVDAQLVIKENHEYTYADNGDGTHCISCANCGTELWKREYHSYDENGYCEECGAFDTMRPMVTDVEVSEKRIQINENSGYKTKFVYKYVYKIATVEQNVGVESVEYSLDGENWIEDDEFVNAHKLNEFKVRVTDTNDNVTYWLYKDGEVISCIMIISLDASKTYDGEPLTAKYIHTGNIACGDTLVAELSSITDAGTADSKVLSYKIMRGEEDVTSSYVFVDSVDGKLEVKKRDVLLMSGSAQKKHDGTPLTKSSVQKYGFAYGEGVTCTVTGSQTAVGESKNTFTYEFNEGTKAENYNVTVIYGTLKVTAGGFQPPQPPRPH